jgi:ATP-dependent RNA helicase DeaD
VDPRKLDQVFYDVPDNEKFSLLVHLLKKEKSDLVMVFCNTRRNTGFVVRNLSIQGIPAVSVHGGYTQAKRNMIMEDFHAKKIKVLVCTDVAARGLDIEGISHVYNYELPKDAKDYIHRIGRTARAGKDGKAINLLSSRDYENFNKIEDDPSLHIIKMELPRIETIIPRSFSENRSRGSDGRAYRFGHRQDYHRPGRSDFHRGGERHDSHRPRSFSKDRDDYHRGDRDRSDSRPRRSFHSGDSRDNRSFQKRRRY